MFCREFISWHLGDLQSSSGECPVTIPRPNDAIKLEILRIAAPSFAGPRTFRCGPPMSGLRWPVKRKTAGVVSGGLFNYKADGVTSTIVGPRSMALSSPGRLQTEYLA